MDGFADSSKRGNASAKRLDLTELRAALADGRVMPAVGLVWLPPGETVHYDLEPDQSGNNTDILVHVQKMPNEEPLLCYLACSGLWRIPPVGTPVVLLIPDGDLDAGAIIVGALSDGTAPAALDGDTLTGEAPKVDIKATAGDAKVDASGNVVLGGGSTAAAIGSTDLATWMSQVEAGINGLAPGAVSPLSTAITYTSAKVKA